MKKVFFTLLVLTSHLANSQNSYDIYNRCTPANVAQYLYSGFTNYTGEYQIFLEEDGSI